MRGVALLTAWVGAARGGAREGVRVVSRGPLKGLRVPGAAPRGEARGSGSSFPLDEGAPATAAADTHTQVITRVQPQMCLFGAISVPVVTY